MENELFEAFMFLGGLLAATVMMFTAVLVWPEPEKKEKEKHAPKILRSKKQPI